jgi:hypothetical protein
MKIWFVIARSLDFEADLPSSGPLWTIKFNYASRNEKQAFWGIMCVNDLAFFVFNYAIKHVDMGTTNDEETS